MIVSHLSVLQGTWPRLERGFLCLSHEGLPNTVLMWHASWSWFLSFFCPASRTLLVKCCELLVTFGNGVGAGKVVLMSKLFIRFLTISFTVRKLCFCFWFCGGRCCTIFCFCRGWWALRKRITWCRYQHDLRFASNLSFLPHWWCAWLRLHQCHPFLRVSMGGNGCHNLLFANGAFLPSMMQMRFPLLDTSLSFLFCWCSNSGLGDLTGSSFGSLTFLGLGLSCSFSLLICNFWCCYFFLFLTTGWRAWDVGWIIQFIFDIGT